MNIISHNSLVTRIEARKCIELLGEDYTTLPYEIFIYKDLNEVIEERHNNPCMPEEKYEYLINDPSIAPPGVCFHSSKTIKLFPFNVDKHHPFEQKLFAIGFLFHEIRHAYQNERNMYPNETDALPIGDEYINYLNKASERDAYDFGEQMMNLPNNKQKIPTILGYPELGYEFSFDVDEQIRKYKESKKLK